MKKIKNVHDEWTPAQGDYQVDYESTRTYERKKRRKKILISVVTVLFVVALLIGGYFLAQDIFFSNGQV